MTLADRIVRATVRPPGPSELKTIITTTSGAERIVGEEYEVVRERLREASTIFDPVLELTRGGSDERILFCVGAIEHVREERRLK